ncbi:gliding motility associated protien GldN [Mucilaginibacter mallensis]|uniref:Gliding motility associated protien GldN n=1 Tax=Mucilaginibacter mallensis TaxID=652787 RepID=A0A1H1RKK7_MUCMA|nr:gliding motility protein GldN [Mucilaginibacter mallensis]SDS36284.1 gliding motility associated protien GldN [Mucilaginibacter mallensis]
MKTKILLIVLCLACTVSFAQKKKRSRKKKAATTTQTAAPIPTYTPSTALSAQPSDTSKRAPLKPFDRPLDGYYKKSDILNARVTPYPNIREADVAYAKRIWREIDVRDKMNQYMASPKQRLIDILMTAIANGELTAYDPSPDPKNDPDGDGFAHPLTPGQAKNKMADSSVVDKFDKDGNKISSVLTAGEFNPDSVVKFRIKEDWIFDKARSVFEPRIIGIAPMIKPKAGSLDLDYQPAFWIYFPDVRPILVTKEVVSKNSDATGLSYDDVFMKRLFNSYIVKVSNEKDERIKDYAQGIDRLYESEKIKKSLLDWELNLWQY